MEPRHYLAVLIRRWLTVAVLSTLAVLTAGILTILTPPTYTSTTALLFTVPGGARPGEVSQDAQYVESTITSLIAVTRSPAVLAPVIERGGLDMTTTELAETLTIGVIENTTILEISAAAPSPQQAVSTARWVSQELQVAIAELSPGPAGPLDVLQATTIEPASEPQFPSSPDLKRNFLLGGIAGLVLGILVALYRESVGARISSARDVEVLTNLPVWRVSRERSGRFAQWSRLLRGRESDRPSALHSSDIRRLGMALDSMIQADSVTTISLQSAPRLSSSEMLATGLADVMTAAGHRAKFQTATGSSPRSGERDPDMLVFNTEQDDDPAESAAVATTAAGHRWGLAVVETGRTRRRALESLLSGSGRGPTSMAGVVIASHQPASSGGLRHVLERMREPRPSSSYTPDKAGMNRPAVVARSTEITAAVALFLAGMAFLLPFGLNTAFLASVALAPVWITAVRRYRFASVLLGVAVLCLIYGYLLADRAAVDHVIDGYIATETSMRFLGAFGTVGLILWARTFMPIWRIALWYGTGWLLTGVTQLPGTPNPWKFQLAFGVTFIVLALVTKQRRASASAAALLGLGLVSVILDFRSWFAFCAITAGLVAWQGRPRAAISKPTSRLLSLLFLAALGAGAYASATYAIVGGYLGDELQARSVEQIQTSGSLIAGGRPEWTITWVLMQRDPVGFGVGVVPNAHDVLAGEEGFATVNVLFQSDYVDFLFGDQLKLHSMVADFWSHFGIPGLVFSLFIGGVLLAGFNRVLSRREASPLAIFLMIASLWNLPFQPIYSSLPSLALALGVLLWEDDRVSRKGWKPLASSRSATTPPPAPQNADLLSVNSAGRQPPVATRYASPATS